MADLSLTSDDAFAFMARYAETFGVQQGDDDPSAYFEPEGLCLLSAWRRPMSLEMLECAAREGGCAVGVCAIIGGGLYAHRR